MCEADCEFYARPIKKLFVSCNPIPSQVFIQKYPYPKVSSALPWPLPTWITQVSDPNLPAAGTAALKNCTAPVAADDY